MLSNANEQRVHGNTRIPFRTNHGVEPEAKRLEDGAADNDSQVCPCVRLTLITGAHGPQQRVQQRQSHDCQQDGCQQEEDQRMPKHVFGLVASLLSQTDRYERSRTEPDQHAERHQNQHEGEGERRSGDPQWSDRVTHKHPIHDVVQGLGQHSDDGRGQNVSSSEEMLPLPSRSARSMLIQFILAVAASLSPGTASIVTAAVSPGPCPSHETTPWPRWNGFILETGGRRPEGGGEKVGRVACGIVGK